MIDQSRIASGFDLELLLSERYLKYFLLTSFETGSMPWYVQDVDPVSGIVSHIMIHPPRELEENRLYDPRADFVPHPFLDRVPVDFTNLADACAIELLPDELDADIRVTLIVSVITKLPGSPNEIVLTEQDMTLDARFFVTSDPAGPDGSQRNARFRLEAVDINGPFVDKARALEVIRKAVDRDIPLTFIGNGGAVQQIASQKFFAAGPDDPPTCLGLYVNLKLRSGPEATEFFEPRGDLALAQNFLPRGHEMAFGFNADLYSKLSSDIFQRMARPKDGGFFYPLDPEDPDRGHINSVSVFPQGDNTFDPAHVDANTVFPNILVIRVKGELNIDSFFEPDFTMIIRLRAFIDDDGVLTFNPDFDLNVPATGFIIVGAALLSFLSLHLAIPTTLAALALRAIIEKMGEDEAVPIIEEQLGDASLFDTLPSNLPVEERRWDPGYFTSHQIVALVKDVAINDLGMAFAGHDLRVGKEPRLIENSVIRSETRDTAGNVSGLLYKIDGWNSTLEEQLPLVFPATDRMDFTAIVPPVGVESHRLHLTVDQALARVEAKRLIDKIVYRPYKMDEQAHQIYQLLVLSNIEAKEIRARAEALFPGELEQAHGAEYDQQAREELRDELGREPTDAEVQERHNEIRRAAVKAGIDKRFRLERERFLKFDLEPFELADLEQKKLLRLEFEGLQIIRMRASAGGAVYYRDTPDKDKGDNLRRLPRYKSEPIVRV